MLSNRSLRFKINLSIAVILLIVSLVFGTILAIYEITRRDDAIQQVKRFLDDLTAQYSEQLGNEIFAGQELALSDTLAQLKKRRNILTIDTYDEIGNPVVTSAAKLPEGLELDQLRPFGSPIVRLQRWHNQSVLTYISPIIAYSEPVGYWQIRYAMTTLNHQTLEIVSIFTTLIISLSLLLGLLLNHILQRFVLKPVYALRNAMHYIENRDGPAAQEEIDDEQSLARMVNAFDELSCNLKVSKETQDEIGSLGYAFQHMLLALKNAYIGGRTDALTKLNNRRKLDEVLEFEIKQSSRYQNPFASILLDIDYFKTVNDTYGHQIGDKVLVELAGLLQNCLRETDIAGRWGGEEFIIILRQQNRQQALHLAEKLRNKIGNYTFTDAKIAITASFGISEYFSGDSAFSLVKRADDALYEAKKFGRNRISWQ